MAAAPFVGLPAKGIGGPDGALDGIRRVLRGVGDPERTTARLPLTVGWLPPWSTPGAEELSSDASDWSDLSDATGTR